MNRLFISVLNLILIIMGFLIVYSVPLNALAIIFGMLLISISIISFAVLIYFPPAQPRYVRLKVIEEPNTTKRKVKKKVKKRTKRRKR